MLGRVQVLVNSDILFGNNCIQIKIKRGNDFLNSFTMYWKDFHLRCRTEKLTAQLD